MYINYFKKEMFEDSVPTTSVNTCNIDVSDMIGEPLTVDDCNKYSNQDYKTLRDEYWEKIQATIDGGSDLECLKETIKDNSNSHNIDFVT